MTITTSQGCNWTPSAQSQAGSFNCMITATITYSGCTITMTNESFQTYCDGNNQCSFTEINNIAQTIKCDGSSWTSTITSNGQTLTETGSCSCQKPDVVAVPSPSAAGAVTPPPPNAGSSKAPSTSTLLFMVCAVACGIIGTM
ncbi:hypothetical protein BGW37DRAFT_523591 [Umbelopsis sp. PMI_123]|nr:hypothetical protein BGW37DRAFT_523591 [Umbelopsis sp. PMI_123]